MNVLTALLPLAALSSPALAADPEMILKSGHFACPERYAAALEPIADARDRAELEAAVRDAISRGRCGGSLPLAIAITQVHTVSTSGGRPYACFHQLDPVDRRDIGAFCALSRFVTTIADEVGRRHGDYAVTREDAAGMDATCTEGGSIRIMKSGTRWERLSMLFPKRLDPLTRRVPADRESALRDGCRGADYVN